MTSFHEVFDNGGSWDKK